MADEKAVDREPGKDRTPPERERDVSVWARAHGVSADELSGGTKEGQTATAADRARERRDAEAEQVRDKD